MSFKYISYLELWQPLCSMEWNGTTTCLVQEMLLKIYLFWISGGPPVWWSGAIYAILKEGIMDNIHVKSYEIWTGGSAVPRFT